jgi:hypothetical protein
MAAQEILDLASLEKAIEHTDELFGHARPWWSGHGKQTWELIARVFRREAGADGNEPYRERELLTHFMDRAITRHTSCPDRTDLFGWMFLARHYGLPTRLLDWTASPLIALYFAVCDNKHDTEPGHLYALSPGRLNEATAEQNTERFSTMEPLVLQYALDAIGDTTKVYKDTLPTAISICTREIDARLVVQQSVFTLHADETALPKINGSQQFLKVFTIPTTAKQGLRNRLAWLGLRPADLFPDLEHLAAELREAKFHDSPV